MGAGCRHQLSERLSCFPAAPRKANTEADLLRCASPGGRRLKPLLPCSAPALFICLLAGGTEENRTSDLVIANVEYAIACGHYPVLPQLPLLVKGCGCRPSTWCLAPGPASGSLQGKNPRDGGRGVGAMGIWRFRLVGCGRIDASGGWEGVRRRTGDGGAHCDAALEERAVSALQMVWDMRSAGDARSRRPADDQSPRRVCRAMKSGLWS